MLNTPTDTAASTHRPLPPSPTPHAPGSLGKLAVLVARAEEGYALWHPRDAGDAVDRANKRAGRRGGQPLAADRAGG
jgi:hypothetical protein